MAQKQIHAMPADVLPRYFVGGQWMAHILLKKGRGSRTSSKPGNLRVLTPPPEGWRGGLPEANGYRPKGGK